ncbi:MAG: phage terminase small subunit P27 family [Phycisphaerales bacterium]|nr:phage terminase small subunit P27 family [Phycisphaerales bacterium]
MKNHTAIPVCPKYVKGEARKEWDRLAPALAEKGLLDKVDIPTLARYCITHARWIEAEANVAKYGLTVKTPTGMVIQNPSLGISNTAAKLLTKYASIFRLSTKERKAAVEDEMLLMTPPKLRMVK